MPAVIRREAASRDLTNHFVYLAEHASLKVADRFLACARTSFRQLSQMPLMGASAGIRSGKNAGVRIWPVRDFRKYLILYRPITKGVQIERVIHAAVDYKRVLT